MLARTEENDKKVGLVKMLFVVNNDAAMIHWKKIPKTTDLGNRQKFHLPKILLKYSLNPNYATTSSPFK